jgi:hypothetical protein
VHYHCWLFVCSYLLPCSSLLGKPSSSSPPWKKKPKLEDQDVGDVESATTNADATNKVKEEMETIVIAGLSIVVEWIEVVFVHLYRLKIFRQLLADRFFQYYPTNEICRLQRVCFGTK